MSKLARIPVAIKEGVNVSIKNDLIKVSGSKGSLSFRIPKGVVVRTEGNALKVSGEASKPRTKLVRGKEDIKALLGLTRATVANMIKGVSEGFEKKLELSGVGYRASVSGKDLILNVGFSHSVRIASDAEISYLVSDNNIITVSGIDKALVGNAAAKIRMIRPPEPYKGKGIKYAGEKIRRKAGKAAKTVGTK